MTKSISDIQCRGGSGLSSVATVIRTSLPHDEHRKLSLTFLNSPAGGGYGRGVAKSRKILKPIRKITYPIAIANRTLITVPTIPPC